MRGEKIQSAISFVLVGLLLVGIAAMIGCKKKSESAAPVEINQVSSAVNEQTTCPVMGGAINPDIFTEHKGKKVYFCCPSCKGKFEQEPEKYTSKLPQFKD